MSGGWKRGGNGIGWCDETWNAIKGCQVYSDECKFCYAMEIAGTLARSSGAYDGLVRTVKGKSVWTGSISFAEHELQEISPTRHKKGLRVFVDSMSDWFYRGVPEEWVFRCFEALLRAPQHDFQLLTKRLSNEPSDRNAAERVLRLCERLPWAPHIWLGTSIGIQDSASRADALRATPAHVKFISIEPWIEPVHLDLRGIDWVILGGESGTKGMLDAGVIRRCDPGWMRELVAEARRTGTAVYVKQLGGVWAREQGLPGDADGKKFHNLPEDLRIREFPRPHPQDREIAAALEMRAPFLEPDPRVLEVQLPPRSSRTPERERVADAEVAPRPRIKSHSAYAR